MPNVGDCIAINVADNYSGFLFISQKNLGNEYFTAMFNFFNGDHLKITQNF